MKSVQFCPKEELLQSIRYQGLPPLITIFPTLPKEPSDQELDEFGQLFTAIRIFLEENLQERFLLHQHFLQVNMLSEPLRNGMEHGNRSDSAKQVAVAVWIGECGVLFAFQDEGDFFSKQEVKLLYESRSKIESTRFQGPGGNGTRYLYKKAKDIYVAIDENTLYATYFVA
jgi:hypothetical protein